PSRSGDLWVDVAMGAGDREHVVRYGPDGSVKGIYQLPRGFLARALTMDPDGGVWALSEEWSIDPESKQVHLNNALVPVELPGSFQAPSDPLSLVLEGSFFGEDGLLYRVRSDGRVEEGHVSPPYEVTSWTKSGSKVASYSLPPDVRPFAADAQGRLYAEHLAPEQPVAAGLSSVGDPANEAAMLWIVERDGSLTKLPVPRQDLFTEWAPIAWPRADGRLVTTKVDGVSLAVLELKPVNRRAVDAQAPFDPEVTVIEPTEPMSGDPYAAIDVAQRDLMKLVYSGLVSFDGSLTPVPDLARRVPTKANGLISPDGKTIRWEMRTDVRWHDGRSVTPGDVVATYRYLRYTSYLPHGRPFPGFDAIEDVRAEGDSVIVRLSRPVGVASEAFFPFVLPAHALPGTPTANPELFAKPVGCGPYRLVRWEDGSGVVPASPRRRVEAAWTRTKRARRVRVRRPGPPTLPLGADPSHLGLGRRG
ncbi:MAG: ABC transporter substrate-binding protein, partial [Coriobacteriia bacterium]|nr:ABC transporter substrate-binding protein [Coriobacteriia bacterium]